MLYENLKQQVTATKNTKNLLSVKKNSFEPTVSKKVCKHRNENGWCTKTQQECVLVNLFNILNKVYQEVFTENAPARSTPQVMPFPAGILISVECIALV